jgi:hypothetical protein
MSIVRRQRAIHADRLLCAPRFFRITRNGVATFILRPLKRKDDVVGLVGHRGHFRPPVSRCGLLD